MSRLEDELNSALRRKQAPEGFADQVLSRVGKQDYVSEPTRWSWQQFFVQPALRWAAAAALLAAVIAGGVYYREAQMERARRAAGEAAKQQLMIALRIASSKLQLAKAKVSEVGVAENENRNEKE